MAVATAEKPKNKAAAKPRTKAKAQTAGELAKQEAEKEAKRLAGLNDDSRKLGVPVGSKDKEKKAKRGKDTGFRAAAEKILRAAEGPMHNRDITAAVLASKFTKTTGGKKPEESMYVILHQGVKRGIFVKTDPSTFDLKELNPKGAKKRPATA